jgi:hypothetical protein
MTDRVPESLAAASGDERNPTVEPEQVARRRDRPIQREPVEVVRRDHIGIDPIEVERLVGGAGRR